MNFKKLFFFQILFFFTFIVTTTEAAKNPSELGLPGNFPPQWQIESTNNPQIYTLRLPAYQTHQLIGRISQQPLGVKKDEKAILQELNEPVDFSWISPSLNPQSTISSLSLYREKPYRIFYQKLTTSDNKTQGLATLYFVHAQSLYKIEISASNETTKDTDLFEIPASQTAAFLSSFYRDQFPNYKGPAHQSLEAYYYSPTTKLQIPLEHTWKLTTPLSDGFIAVARASDATTFTLKINSLGSENSAPLSFQKMEDFSQKIADELKKRRYSYKITNSTLPGLSRDGTFVSAEDDGKTQPSLRLAFFQDQHFDYRLAMATPAAELNTYSVEFDKQITKIKFLP